MECADLDLADPAKAAQPVLLHKADLAHLHRVAVKYSLLKVVADRPKVVDLAKGSLLRVADKADQADHHRVDSAKVGQCRTSAKCKLRRPMP